MWFASLACQFGTKHGRKYLQVPLNNSPIIHSFFALGVFLAIVIGVAIALVVMVRYCFSIVIITYKKIKLNLIF